MRPFEKSSLAMVFFVGFLFKYCSILQQEAFGKLDILLLDLIIQDFVDV
jgi:hypothetical protein